jgi:hypothetical protein
LYFLLLGEPSSDVNSIVMDNQVKMALKLLNFKSERNSPARSPRNTKENIRKKYRAGSQGLLKRNGSVNQSRYIKKVVHVRQK